MPETGAPGSSSTPPEPAPQTTVWKLRAPGYRIGVIRERRALVIEVLDYHPGFLLVLAEELDRMFGREGPG